MSARAGEGKFADLGVRILSALVLAAVAAASFVAGGHYVAELVGVGVVLMLWEFRRFLMPDMSRRDWRLWLLCGSGLAVVTAVEFGTIPIALLVAAIGAGALIWSDRAKSWWLVPALVYIALGMAFLIIVRADPDHGLARVLWIIGVVIAADVGGYFAGRIIGGPKLWPRVSPKKTWAGSLGGIALAMVVGAVFWLGGWIGQSLIVPVSALIAIASQAGDLLESSIKRHFAVKDSSALIPGHGGLLDRFDGLMGALWAYAGLALFGVVPM